MSDSTLATALVEAQAEMPAVDKTGKSNFGSHATLDHIIAKTRGVLNKHGLSIVQFPVVTEQGGPGLQTTITHKSGESASSVMPLLLVKQDMQSLGSAITYARRYAWASALGISAESDDDGEQATRPKASEGEPKADLREGAVAPAAVAPVDTTAPLASPSEEPVMISVDQRGKIAQLVVEAAKANNSTGPKLKATLEGEYGPFDKLTAAAADELIGKLLRWTENAKAAA